MPAPQTLSSDTAAWGAGPLPRQSGLGAAPRLNKGNSSSGVSLEQCLGRTWSEALQSQLLGAQKAAAKAQEPLLQGLP